jgi:5,10-methylenetetrahydromethanopterin reductase
VYLAAEGPRTLELAGRVADGVIVGLGLTPDVIRLSLAAIERGARAAGRALADLDVWWFAKTNVADTRDEAVAPITMALAASANHAFRFALDGKGVPPGLHDRIRGLQREYDAHHHEIAGAGNAGLTDRWGLTEFLVDRFAIAGTPGDCVAQIRRAMAAGARQFVITGFVPDRSAFMRRWMREIAPAVGEAGSARRGDSSTCAS